MGNAYYFCILNYFSIRGDYSMGRLFSRTQLQNVRIILYVIDEEDSPFKLHISPSTVSFDYHSRILYMSRNFANPDEFSGCS